LRNDLRLHSINQQLFMDAQTDNRHHVTTFISSLAWAALAWASRAKNWLNTFCSFIEYVIRFLISYLDAKFKYRCIPYNLGLKIVNNKTKWYVTMLFSLFSSHLFTGKLTKTSSCLPTKWRRRHRACILLCSHYWTQKHWPIIEKQWGWKQTKLNYIWI